MIHLIPQNLGCPVFNVLLTTSPQKTNPHCHLFIHSFIQGVSIAHLPVHYYSEALPTQLHGYCAGISRQSATGKWE